MRLARTAPPLPRNEQVWPALDVEPAISGSQNRRVAISPTARSCPQCGIRPRRELPHARSLLKARRASRSRRCGASAGVKPPGTRPWRRPGSRRPWNRTTLRPPYQSGACPASPSSLLAGADRKSARADFRSRRSLKPAASRPGRCDTHVVRLRRRQGIAPCSTDSQPAGSLLALRRSLAGRSRTPIARGRSAALIH